MQLGPLQINKWNRNWYVRWLTMIWFELDDRPHRGSIRITTINLYYLLLHCVSLLLFFLLLIHFCLRDVRWFCFAHDSSAPTSSFETLKYESYHYLHTCRKKLVVSSDLSLSSCGWLSSLLVSISFVNHWMSTLLGNHIWIQTLTNRSISCMQFEEDCSL